MHGRVMIAAARLIAAQRTELRLLRYFRLKPDLRPLEPWKTARRELERLSAEYIHVLQAHRASLAAMLPGLATRRSEVPRESGKRDQRDRSGADFRSEAEARRRRSRIAPQDRGRRSDIDRGNAQYALKRQGSKS